MREVLEGALAHLETDYSRLGVSGAGRLFTACAQQPERT